MRRLLTVTEIGMLLYWVFASLVALGLVSVDPQWMYSNYEDPVIVAWNWSFLPLDLLFALAGLLARFAPMADKARRVLAVVSLSLMFCAGLMAVSFWTIQQFYDPFWWGTNLWLVLLSSIALVGRARSESAA